MEHRCINVSKPKKKFRLFFFALLILFFGNLIFKAIWLSVTVRYPAEGEGEIRYIWNVQDEIYKGGMKPGGVAYDVGHLFPGDDYFMEFNWWKNTGGRRHCVSITPGWFEVHIQLDLNGEIDRHESSGTTETRLKACEWDSAKM